MAQLGTPIIEPLIFDPFVVPQFTAVPRVTRERRIRSPKMDARFLSLLPALRSKEHCHQSVLIPTRRRCGGRTERKRPSTTRCSPRPQVVTGEELVDGPVASAGVSSQITPSSQRSAASADLSRSLPKYFVSLPSYSLFSTRSCGSPGA